MPSHPLPLSPTPTGLLQLPPDLLRLVWDKLRCHADGSDGAAAVAAVRDQHALRMASKQLQLATTPFISTMVIAINSEDEEPPSTEQMLHIALRQCAAFPAAATPTALRWSLVERDEHEHYAMRPQLLPEIFLRLRNRLAKLERVVLTGELALGYGEICSLVHACPVLTALDVRRGPILGPALAPLTALMGLRALSLDDVSPADVDREQAGRIYAPLGALSALTKLEATWLAYEDILPHPHLRGLGLLRELVLRSVLTLGDDRDDAFSHLQHLSSLTALLVDFIDGARLDRGLALPPSLVNLYLRVVSLGTAAIRLVASGLPLLSQLDVFCMDPDCDLSGMACSYSALELTLRHSATPLQFARLPLRGVKLLCIAPQCPASAPASNVTWLLDVADLESTFATLTRACHVLAPLLGGCSLRLGLNLSAAAPASSTAPLLAALAPFALCPLTFHLCLGTNWDVGGEHVDRLAAVVPDLSSLWVLDAGRPGFGGFAVGAKLQRLTSLLAAATVLPINPTVRASELPRQSQDLLLALAMFRVTNELPLSIEVGASMSQKQVDRCNTVVELFRDSIGRTARNQVTFSR